MKVQVRTLDAADAGELELSEAVFGLPARADILHRVVLWLTREPPRVAVPFSERNARAATTWTKANPYRPTWWI